MQRNAFTLLVVFLLALELLAPFSFAAPTVAQAKTTAAASLSPYSFHSTVSITPSFALPSTPSKASMQSSYGCEPIREMPADQAREFVNYASRMRVNDINSLVASQSALQARSGFEPQSSLSQQSEMDPVQLQAYANQFAGGNSYIANPLPFDDVAAWLGATTPEQKSALAVEAGLQVDPVTGQPVPNVIAIDPATGNPRVDPLTGQQITEVRVPYNTVIAIAQSQGRNQVEIQSFLSGLLGTSSSPQAELPYFANYKLRLPIAGSDGEYHDVPVELLLAQQPLNKECSFKDLVIQGRVTYEGLLDHNIAYGTGLSVRTQTFINPSSGQVDIDFESTVKQYLESRGTFLAGVRLPANAGNILIPSFFERWAVQMGKSTRAELAVAVGMGIASGVATKMAASQLKVLEGKLTHYKDLTKMYSDRLTRATTVVDTTTVLGYTPAGSPIYGISSGAQTPVLLLAETTEAEQAARATMAKFETQMVAFRSTEGVAQSISKTAALRVSFNLIFGMGWLGPMRLAFEVAEAQLFDGEYNPKGDKFLLLMVNRPVATAFRDATSGFKLTDLLSDLLGSSTKIDILKPPEIWASGKVRLINQPALNSQSEGSSTTIDVTDDGRWHITMQWADSGVSYATNMEDVSYVQRGSGEITSLPVAVNEILPAAAVMDQKANAHILNSMGSLAASAGFGILVAGPYGALLGFGAGMLTLTKIYSLDAAEAAKYRVHCEASELNEYLSDYISTRNKIWFLTAFQSVLQVGVHGGFSFVPYVGAVIPIIATVLNAAADLGQFWLMMHQIQAANGGTAYSTECIDQMHKILFWQRLSQTAAEGQGQGAEAAVGFIDNIVAMFVVSDQATAREQYYERIRQRPEILTLKVQLNDQVGYVEPEEMYNIHAEESNLMLNTGLFQQLEDKCFRQTLSDENGWQFSVTANGMEFTDPAGNVVASFNTDDDAKRALARWIDQENARYFIPNKFFEVKLTGCSGTLMSFDTAGYGTLFDLSPSCTAGNCIVENHKTISGRTNAVPLDFAGNMRDIIGKVMGVQTSEGYASFDGSRIYFTASDGALTRAPDADQPTSASIAGTLLHLKGDGSMELETGGATQSVGDLVTIVGASGRIDFDGSNLWVFVNSLATSPFDYFYTPTQPLSLPANPDNLLDFDFGAPKPGFESEAQPVLDALDQVAPDGYQSIETPLVTTWMGEDENGVPGLYVRDNETGEIKFYPLSTTQRPYLDANGNIVYPLADGKQIVLTYGKDAQGNPAFGLQTPDKEFDLATWLAGRGEAGGMYFNPQTGAISVANGWDIPMSPDFASQGMNFMTGQDGATHAVPGGNPFEPPKADAYPKPGSSSLVLPAWPENNLLVIAMIALMLLGVAAVRLREQNEL
ncbi:MAG: hypothetical protein V1834_00350 [Candidatus Micrarchaeota archaeon]